MRVVVEITGMSDIQNKLKRLGTNLLDLSTSMKLIGKTLGQYYANEVFASQGGVFGERWPALSASTLEQKLKDYPQFANVPLVRTGALREGFTAEATNNSVIIGNSVSYFKYHQSTAPRTKIPRRAMMGINDPIRQLVVSIIEKEVKEKIDSA